MIKRQEVYDLYWYFAYERQNIFLKKKEGLNPPYTEDKILQEYKFCNSYRVNDRVSLLRFVPHGKGTTDMDLSKEELLAIKNLYLNSNDKDKIRLGTPWNILGIENTPCIIADEIMIIGFDGIAYPCDSIKYFTKLGISGNIRETSLMEMYNSEYFSNIRKFNTGNSCFVCEQYHICKSGCIGQKIIANYTEIEDKVLTLKRCINSRDPKCMR